MVDSSKKVPDLRSGGIPLHLTPGYFVGDSLHQPATISYPLCIMLKSSALRAHSCYDRLPAAQSQSTSPGCPEWHADVCCQRRPAYVRLSVRIATNALAHCRQLSISMSISSIVRRRTRQHAAACPFRWLIFGLLTDVWRHRIALLQVPAHQVIRVHSPGSEDSTKKYRRKLGY